MSIIRIIAEVVGYITIMYGIFTLIWLNMDEKKEINSSMYFDDEVNNAI